MEKYYYVVHANQEHYLDENGFSFRTDTFKRITQCGYYRPINSNKTAFSLNNVKEIEKEIINKGILGIRYVEKFTAYDSFFIICADHGNFLEDVITGRQYEEVKKDYNSRYYDTLKFAKVEEVPSAEVVEQLKSLSDNDIERYADALSKLEEAVSIGYHEDMERMNAVEE